MAYDDEFTLEHSPHSIARTEENSVARLHPGQMIKYKPPKKANNSTTARVIPANDHRSRRGTPLMALILSLQTVPDSAFDPVSGLLKREWLHEARPQLFYPDGKMQEYVKTKTTPAGFDYSFECWLRGDMHNNCFTKAKVQIIVQKVQREIVRKERAGTNFSRRWRWR